MVVLLTVALVACAFGSGIAQAAVGVEDFSYAADPASPVPHQPTAPTGEKPQSKLWFNDGIWWGSIWSKTKYTIQGYSSTGQWVDTGVTIDPRDKSQADMYWDQSTNHLYAISNVHEANSTNDPAVRLYRFSYNAAAKTYTPDWTTPVVIFQPASTTDLETVTMDKDSTGMLWATFTYANSPGNCVTKSTCPAGRSVLIAHSTVGNDQAWSTPVVLPSPDVSPGVPRATDVSGNDISAIVHFGNKIGVMYSDQTPDPGTTSDTGDYFAWHTDGAAATAWTTETALAGKRAADDHINLKAAPDGTLFAAVKTSSNDAGSPVASAPLIDLLKRSTTGTWTTTVFDTEDSQDTRSQILLDPTNNAIYQFATYPPDGVYESGGKIYCKVTSMSSPLFAPGRGTPFIDIAPGDHLNNFSSTKQTVGSASGIFGIAGDDVNMHYAHNSFTIVDGAAPSCTGPVIVPPVTLVPPPVTPVTPPKPVTPVVPPVVTPPVAPPVVTPVVTTPIVKTTSTTCRVMSSSIKVRSLSSALASLKKTSAVRLKVKATCSLRLTLAAALGTRHGAIVGRASVFLKKGTTRTILVHLTRAGKRMIKHRSSAKIFVTTRTPAVKGLSPARIWSTTIAYRS